ncbi:MAG: serine/threonine-protein kinase [Polyangiales bacterium]
MSRRVDGNRVHDGYASVRFGVYQMNRNLPKSTSETSSNQVLKARQTLGKYRIRRRIGTGGFATVYEAYDTVEGIPVALKVPHLDRLERDALSLIHREVRLTARLEHEHILPLRNAMMIDGHFVIATPLGEQALTDRLRYRLGPKTALSYTEQLLDALAYAHQERIIHCDIKPDNVIIFPNDQVRLADFGIAKVALRTRTIMGSGQGTVGYMAPEQAMGKPSFRSDVFSMGLVIYRMFAGELPAWPFDWPLPGAERLRRTVSRDFISFLRRSIEIRERKRFRDGVQMQAAFLAVAPRALRRPTGGGRAGL